MKTEEEIREVVNQHEDNTFYYAEPYFEAGLLYGLKWVLGRIDE